MASEVYEIELRDKATPKLRKLDTLIEQIAADMGRASTSLDRMERELVDVGRSADAAAKGATGFRTSIIALDSAFNLVRNSAGLARSAFNLFKEPVTFAVDVESGINAIRTITGELRGDLREQLLALPAEIGRSTTDTLKAAYDALSAGVRQENLVGVLRQAGRLARAGQADLTTTLGALQKSLESYRSTGISAVEVSDILFETVRQGTTTLPELANSITQVTGSAAEYGVTFQEVGAATAQLTRTSGSTAQAVVQLRDVIKNLAKPTQETLKALEGTGVQLGIGQLQAKGLSGVLNELQAAFGNNSKALGALFRDNEANLGLLGLLRDGQEGYRTALENTNNAAGATARANAIVTEGARGLLDRLNALKEQALREIGERLLPRVVEGAEALLDAFRADGPKIIDDLTDGLKAVGEALVVLAKVAVTAARAIGSLARGTTENFRNMAAGARSLRDGLISLGDRFPVLEEQTRNQVPAAQAAALAQEDLRSAIDRVRRQLDSIETDRVQQLSESAAQAVAPVTGLQSSVTALSQAFGVAGIAAAPAAAAVAKFGLDSAAAVNPVTQLAQRAAVLTASLSGVPGAAIAAAEAVRLALAGIESRAVLGTQSLAPRTKPKKPPKAPADTSQQDEERRRREALAVQQRVDALIERAQQDAARRAAEARRLNADARVEAIAVEGDRTLAALELQFDREREAFRKAGADLTLLAESQERRRTDALRQAADARLQARQAEFQASAQIANNLAGLAETLAQGSRRAAGFVALFKGVALASNALSAAVEAKLEFARGNILQGVALSAASALGFARAAQLKAQGQSLGASGGGAASSAASAGGGGGAAAPSSQQPSLNRSDFNTPEGGGDTIVINAGTVVGGGGLRELSRLVGPRADRYVNGRSGYIGERQ